MRHLSQQMISMELRRPHLRRMRRKLHGMLGSPNLSSDQRRVLERELGNLGEPKVYDLDDPPIPGALRGGERSPLTLDLEGETHETLSAIPHTALYLYALQHDLEVKPGDTKAQVVKAILSHPKGEQP